eukprot:g10627.t1
MNFFFLWMSGSSPGIFTIMILGYCLTSIVGQFAKANAAFQNFKTIDTTLQWLAYLALCSVSLAYLLYHMAGMGLLPNSSGDWIALIPNVEVIETAGKNLAVTANKAAAAHVRSSCGRRLSLATSSELAGRPARLRRTRGKLSQHFLPFGPQRAGAALHQGGFGRIRTEVPLRPMNNLQHRPEHTSAVLAL